QPRPTSPRLPYTTLFRSEGLAHAGEHRPQLVARLRAPLLDRPLEDAGGVEGVRLEEAGRALVRAAEVVDELLRRRALGIREEDRSEEHTSELQSRFDLVC